jgi:hypothetical protein
LILLRDALLSLQPGKRELSAGSISKLFRYRRDRPAFGVVLRMEGTNRQGTGVWRVGDFEPV